MLDFKDWCLSCWLEFHKRLLNRCWLVVRTEFLTVSEIFLSICLLFWRMYCCEMTFLLLVITNLKYQSTQKNVEDGLYVPQYQIFSQDLLLSIKISKYIVPVGGINLFPPKLHLVTVFHHSKSNPDWYRMLALFTIFFFLNCGSSVVRATSWKAIMLGNFTFLRKIIYLGTCFQPQRDIMVGSRQGWHSWESYILIYGQHTVGGGRA